jgi:alkylation response protein AidB-like acyl-CoA dehydrogenase
MDFTLSQEQEMIRNTARAFFKKEFPSSRLRQVEAKGLSEFLPVYRQMAHQGFLGIAIPEEYGGSGGTWVDLALLNEEAGRALVPSVHLSAVTLVGQALLTMGSQAQKADLLPALASGQTVVTPAYVEEGREPRTREFRTVSIARGDRFVLRGEKRFVEAFEVAATLVVAAMDETGALRLFLVPRASPGIRHREWLLQSLDRVADVALDDVAVSQEAVLPDCDWETWLDVVDGAKIALAAYAVGAAQAALDIAVAYSKIRIQFDRPIGSFQSLQHKLADAAMHVEQARTLVYYTAWVRQERGSCPREAAMTKLLAGNAFRQAAYAATLTHGGYGFMEEQDIQLYFRRAKLLEHQVEGPGAQTEIIIPAAG